jgi:predicted DNA-binding transcriptional regulator AlpA
MGQKRGEMLAKLPAVIHPEMRLTVAQAMQLTGRGRSKFFDDVKAGKLPQPERDGPQFVRFRAGDLIDAMNAKAGA